MSSPRSTNDRRAFVVCTAVAVAVIVGVWVWTVRVTVTRGIAGAREVLSTVAETASDVREQAQPDVEVISAVKAGFQGMIDEKAAQEAESRERQEAVDAVAGMMAEDLLESGDVEE